MAKDWETYAGGTLPERRVYMPDGSYRYPDLIMEKGGAKVAINIGHVTETGLPIARERDSLAALREAGELAHAFFVKY